MSTTGLTLPSAFAREVICMEDSCFSEIMLDPNPNELDGGIKRGFGWLLKYWVRSRGSTLTPDAFSPLFPMLSAL